MSVQLGVNPGSGYSEELNSYCSGSSPPISYLYNSKRTAYQFVDPQMDDYSLLPQVEINGKKVIFTINLRPTLYYDNGFINSLPDLFKKVKFPQNLKQEMLEKIAIIANYLSLGEEYQYLPTTAIQQNGELTFFVKR